MYDVINFANPLAILLVNWSLTFSIMITTIVAFLVQSFYAYRAFVLSGKKIWIPAIILIFGVAGLVLALVYMALLFENGGLFYIPRVTSLATSSLACSLVADIAISTSITWYLLQRRSEVFKKTDNLLRKLIIYTINIGIITT
ncbi:hypothetical protein Clacol_002415, partial [Clathrus columnatus]